MVTKLDNRGMEKVNRSCGFINGIETGADGNRGGLCLAWKDDLQVNLRKFSSNFIDVIVKGREEDDEWRFTEFYGSQFANRRRNSWTGVRRLGVDSSLLWLMSGDFNEILYAFKKKGGLSREERRMEEFREALVDYGLVDIGFSGPWFTWERQNLPTTNIRERWIGGCKWKLVNLLSKCFHLSFTSFFLESLSPTSLVASQRREEGTK